MVYSVHRLSGSADTIEVLVNGERKVVLQIEDHWLMSARVSASGFLIYMRAGGNDGLWAAPFSLDRFELTGDICA